MDYVLQVICFLFVYFSFSCFFSSSTSFFCCCCCCPRTTCVQRCVRTTHKVRARSSPAYSEKRLRIQRFSIVVFFKAVEQVSRAVCVFLVWLVIGLAFSDCCFWLLVLNLFFSFQWGSVEVRKRLFFPLCVCARHLRVSRNKGLPTEKKKTRWCLLFVFLLFRFLFYQRLFPSSRFSLRDHQARSLAAFSLSSSALITTKRNSVRVGSFPFCVLFAVVVAVVCFVLFSISGPLFFFFFSFSCAFRVFHFFFFFFLTFFCKKVQAIYTGTPTETLLP